MVWIILSSRTLLLEHFWGCNKKNHHINAESGSAPVVKASSYPVSDIDAWHMAILVLDGPDLKLKISIL
jgi:hypothetical protein